MILAALGLALPHLFRFLGTAGVTSLEKILDHKKELAIEAGRQQNDARRIELEREAKQLETEIQIKRLQAELGKVDRKRWLFTLAMDLLTFSVMLYWSASFNVRTFGLDADYGVRVSPLNAEEVAVSMIVLGYVFLRVRDALR